MEPNSVVARRFYIAFYRWTSLTLSHGARPLAQQAPGRHAFHTASRSRVQRQTMRRKWGSRSSLVRSYVSKSPELDEYTDGNIETIVEAQNGQAESKSELLEGAKSWLDKPVHSVADESFETMAGGNVIVRNRSEKNIMIEFAIVGDTLETLQKSLGSDLEELEVKHSTKVLLNRNITKQLKSTGDGHSGNMIHSIHLSGTPDDVKQAYDSIRESAKVYNESKESQSQKRGLFKGFDKPIESVAERPSSSLQPHTYAIRQRSADRVTLETVIPERLLELAEVKYGDDLHIISGEGGPQIWVRNVDGQTQGPGRDGLKSITISGSPKQVKQVWGILRNLEFFAQVQKENEVKPLRLVPSNSLEHSQWALRHVSGSNVTMEVGVSDAHLKAIEATNDIKAVAAANDVTFQFGPSEYRPLSVSKQHRKLTGSISISGPFLAVHRVRRWILSDEQESVQHSMEGTNQSSKAHHVSSAWTKNVQARSEAALEDSTTDGVSEPKSATQAEHVIQACSIRILGPQNEKIAKALRNSKSTLKRINTQTGCKLMISGSTTLFRFKGFNSEILSVERAFRDELQSICEALNLSPPELDLKISTLEIRKLPDSKVPVKTTLNPKDAAQLGESVRSALRTLTHPVVLITCRTPERKEDQGQLDAHRVASRGVTVSSFSTVTIRPQPIISFNIKVPSRSWDAMLASKNFRVHLLAATPRGAAVAQAFTKPYEQPHEGFQHLEKMGVDVFFYGRTKAPRINEPGLVIASIHAEVLEKQCIPIGDHVIVVARVSSCDLPHDPEQLHEEDMKRHVNAMWGLAYAKTNFRFHGREIESAAIEAAQEGATAGRQTSQNLSPGERSQEASDPKGLPIRRVLSEAFLSHELAKKFSADHEPIGYRPLEPTKTLNSDDSVESSPSPKIADSADPDQADQYLSSDGFEEPINDPVYDILRATRDAERRGEELDLSKFMGEDIDVNLEALDEADIMEDKDEDDDEFSYVNNGEILKDDDALDASTSLPSSNSGRSHQTGLLRESADVAEEELVRLGQNERSRSSTLISYPSQLSQSFTASVTAATRPDSVSGSKLDSLGKRAYSSVIPSRLRTFPSSRSFGSTSQWCQTAASGLKDTTLDKVVASARETTVGEFLGFQDDGYPPALPRVRRLVRLNKAMHDAGRRLQSHAGKLTDEERAELERTIRANERVISKQLALKITPDLRLMLDRGRVQFPRAAYFESVIENGQAVLLEDAKYLRVLFAEGKLDSERYSELKEELETQLNSLVTETNRLREVVDEGYGEDD